jgi:hypothetical protein
MKASQNKNNMEVQKMTYKANDIIFNCIAWDKAKRKAAEEIPAEEINKKVAEIFPAEKLENMKANAVKEINNIFNDLF